MPIHLLPDLSSTCLEPYRNLRTTNLTRFSGRFIAESKPLVRRLVDSGLPVESFLVDRKYLDEAIAWLPSGAEIYVIDGEQVSELIGFDFHRGFLACGIRPSYLAVDRVNLEKNLRPSVSIESTLLPHEPTHSGIRSWMGVMLIGVQDPENMGSILRSCAALGVSDIFVGPECVDPFARRVLRVSMGNAFKLHFYDARDPIDTLQVCHDLGIDTVAACLTDSSIELQKFQRIGPTLLILGNEAHGIPKPVQDKAQRCIRIDMEMGTDSLNVSVAGGIILHYLSRCSDRTRDSS